MHSARIKKTTINLGTRPSFVVDNDTGEILKEKLNDGIEIRQFSYASNRFIENFPLLICFNRLDDTLAMNLHLIHRFTGEFAVKKNKTKGRSTLAESESTRQSARGSSLTLKSIESIAKDLLSFLQWLIDNDIDWKLALSEPLNDAESTLEELPVWKYRSSLIDKVTKRQLSYKTAVRRINVVRYFYEWAWKYHHIVSLPFELKEKTYYPKNCKNDELGDLLFGMGKGPTKKGGIPYFTSGLELPKKIIQPDSSPDESLQPYSLKELASLLSSTVLDNPTYALAVDLGYQLGLRASDITRLNREDIVNPEEHSKQIFKMKLYGSKGNKDRYLDVSRSLMCKMWNYINTDRNARLVLRWETKYGINNPSHPIPLFIGRQNRRMSEKSISNIIDKVRRNQKKQDRPVIKRTFHDLRATFGTYYAKYLLEQGMKESAVKTRLMRAMGHNSFETTKKYLNFATDEAYGNVMEPWVQEIYEGVEKLMQAKIEMQEVMYDSTF
ncbi:tyrosine-type recombinase/integrase [Photobacterium chitinilyticum]|uniref:Site-specific integrase n=1 Tax=Photobacterium chitinilyticum TaxID=2485123 RepID=A0A3S3RBV5_9GAMM|nr:site-specific integrase [Photobacterium chitinilyticum]RWX57317.1 site-specific integrase [Photobacterium chitinilyticum]